MKICSSCGYELQPGAIFCLSCGKNLSEEKGSHFARPSHSHSNLFRHSQSIADPPPSAFQHQGNHHSSASQTYLQLFYANVFTVGGLISRVVNIILKPKTEWVKIHQEQPVMVRSWSYALTLLLIPTISSILAYGVFGVKIAGLTIKSPFLGLQQGLMTIVCGILSLYATALFVCVIAPGIDSERKLGRSLQLVVYSMTPFWVAGIFFLVPGLQPVVYVMGIYVIYLLYIGLPVLMRTPENRTLVYLIVSITVLIIVQIITAFIVALIFSLFFTQEMSEFSYLF
jgi:hypothetical protein